MRNFSIYYRELTPAEIRTAYAQQRKTPDIAGYTLDEWRLLGKMFVAERKGQLLGFCAHRDFGKKWREIGLIMVFPEFRGQGIARVLFEKSLARAKKLRKNAFVSTKNPGIAKLMETNGMTTEDSFFVLPTEVKKYAIIFSLTSFRIFEFLRKWRKANHKLKRHFGILLHSDLSSV